PVDRLRREPLVAVRVVDRYRDQDDRIQSIWLARKGEIAQKRKQRILSFDLASVDVPLHIHNRAAESVRLRRRGNQRTRSNDVRNLPSLIRLPDRSKDEGRAQTAQRIEELSHVGVAGR